MQLARKGLNIVLMSNVEEDLKKVAREISKNAH